jgi:TRAP-type uncharacterized transport system substrate-binding protein
MRHTARAFALLLLLLPSTSFSQTQDQPKRAVQAVSAEAQLRQDINGNTISVLGGIMNGTFMRFVDDMAKVIDDGDNLRVLPIVGKGGAQNLRDLLYLKGVDLAIISAQSLNEFRNQPGFSNLAERICYVTLLHPEELHIISDKARSIQDLTGKVVAFDGTGSKLAAESLFAPFGIKPKQMVALNLVDAADKMKKGEVDAAVRIGGKPISGADKMQATNPNLKLLEIRYSDALVANFLPTSFTKDDYPGLFGIEDQQDTVAIGVVLIAYNWRTAPERTRRVEKFTQAFFTKFPEIVASKSSHPKWHDVNLRAQLRGWKRCAAAQAWLDSNRPQQRPIAAVDAADARAMAARVAPGDKVEQERLFQEFFKWYETRRK